MASKSLEMLETVSGVEPFREKVTYRLTTGKAKEFIQKDFEEVDAALIAEGKIRPQQAIHVDLATCVPDKKSDRAGAEAKKKLDRKKWQAEHAEDDKQAKRLWLEYNRMYKEYQDAGYLNFYPFILVLSSDVLRYQKRKKRSSIFDINRDSEKVDLKEVYYTLIKNYIFSNHEASSFNQNDWMRQFGIHDRRCGRDLLLISKPHIIGADGRPIKMCEFDSYENQDASVYFLIDPRRVFRKMLQPPNNNRERYDVIITDIERITPKNYRYTVDRKLLTGSPKNRDDERVFAQILDMIAGA